MLLERFINYLSAVKGCSLNTISSYENDLKKFFEFLSKEKIDIKNVNTEIVEKYLNILRKKFDTTSVARTFSSLRTFFKFIVFENIIKKSPMEILSYPKIEKKLPKSILTVEEVERIIEKANINTPIGLRDRAILEVLYGCGLRESELINLRITDVFLYPKDEEYIRVVFGKGNKERLVPLGRKAIEAIENYIKNGREKLKGRKDTEILFLNSRGVKLSRMGLWKIIDKYVRKANIKKEVTPHTFRHSFATHLLENNADIRIVQELLGHVSIETTQIYLKISKEKIRKVIKLHPRNL